MLLQLAANYAETAGIICCTSGYTAFTWHIIEMEPFSIISRLHNALGPEHNTVFICIYQLSQNLLQFLCCEFVGSFHAPAAKYIISMMVMMIVIMMMVVMTAAIRIMTFIFMVVVMVMMVMLVVVVTTLMVMVMVMLMVMVFLHIFN